MDRTVARLSGVVSVRRVGAEVPGDGVEALLARAEVRLLAGDVGTAVAELDRLPGPAATVAAPWLASARLHLAAEAALAELEAEVANALGAAEAR